MIEILLTILLFAPLAYLLIRKSRFSFIKYFFVSILSMGIYYVWLPQHLTTLANELGVGRGTDLLLYGWIVASIVVFLYYSLTIRLLREDITLLTRAAAIEGAKKNNTKREH
jgi:hypothetical protein